MFKLCWPALVLLASCATHDVAIVNIEDENDMASSNVSAIAPPDYALTQLVINDGDPVQAADLRSTVERSMTNDLWIQTLMITDYTASQNAVVGTAWAWGAPYLFTQATSWVNSVLTQDVASVDTGDDLIVDALGNWQFNVASTTNMIAKLRLAVIEDYGGAATVRVIPGTDALVNNGGLPQNEHYSLHGIHRVITAGPARVLVQGIVYDLTGGAGTGTAFMMFDNQIWVRHHNRQTP